MILVFFFIIVFPKCFGYLVPLSCHIHFRIIFNVPTKNFAEIFIGITLNKYVNLEMAVFTTSSFQPIHEHGLSINLSSLIFFINVL